MDGLRTERRPPRTIGCDRIARPRLAVRLHARGLAETSKEPSLRRARAIRAWSPYSFGIHCARPARLYALQLNVYRSILEDEYDYRVSLMLLGQVHPELAGPKIIFVPRMEEELQPVVEDQVARRLAWPEPRPGETAEFALPVGKHGGQRN